MSKNHHTPATAERVELRRDVTIWGSYTWGYADVGADIYVALGLVIGAAQGGAPLAFALAGLVYIMIGLAFTELASSYPVAGGGHYYALRGLGDFWGFVAGAALLLDYTIDIALFATASTGYFNFFLPYLGINLADFAVTIGPIQSVNLLWLGETVMMIVSLLGLNVRGIRESSLVNEVIGLMDLILEMSVVVFGFILAWKPELLVWQWTHEFPTLKQFMYGFSLSIISFVGLESISQAAQETRRPATVIPRTSIALIFTVFILALGFSTVGLGILPWQEFRAHEAETISYVYATESNKHLVGVFSLRELVMARPEAPVSEFMHRRVVSVNLGDSQDSVAQIVAKYNLVAVPVVDNQGRLHGIVTADDALDKIVPTKWKKRLPRLYH